MYVKTQVVRPWFTAGARSPGRYTPPVSALQAALVVVGIAVMSGGLWGLVRGHAAAADIAQPQVQYPSTVCDVAPIGTEFPSRVTFFSEAGLWGDSLTIEAPVSEPIETVRLVTNADLDDANLRKRISSVRLQCGSRRSQVVLFTAANMWSEFGDAQPFDCKSCQSEEINLHTDASWIADQVGSVYFVAHAGRARSIADIYVGQTLSTVVTNTWTQQLADLPSGAEADGGPRLQLIGFFAFTLRQNLKLDDWKCGDRRAHFKLFASLHQHGVFSVSVSETYVDSGWGDAWGCRSKMESELKAGAADAAHQLRDGLNDLLAFVGDHPRYYLVPTWSIREFDLYAGGEPPEVIKW
jgi:hypothetical protein